MSAMVPKKRQLLPSKKGVIAAATSLTAVSVFIRSFARDFIPAVLKNYFNNKFHDYVATLTREITIVIDEPDGGLNTNRLFHAAEFYIGTIYSAKTYSASMPNNEKKIQISMRPSEEIVDNFGGIQLRWRLLTKEIKGRSSGEVRSWQLMFDKKHKNKVTDEYLPHILERWEAVREEKKILKLHTLKRDSVSWQCVNLDHPAKFETLAMDEETKKMIVEDLDAFVRRKELYRRVGKAWKRGYFLYGPPGTGKSSLIAAMANYLKFDVYDLELSSIHFDSDLRKLLIATPNKSILVVEDIDASDNLSHRTKEREAAPPRPRTFYTSRPKVSLSGFLNLIDGLWSSVGDERIIIFTTNHRGKLDPALLRPGRMDMHVHMSYCTPCGFRLLANNYLGGGRGGGGEGAATREHKELVSEAERLIASSKVTPAEVGEQLLKSEDTELALSGLITFLKLKRKAAAAAAASTKSDGITEFIKKAKALPAEKREQILGKDEAKDALKILTTLIQASHLPLP